MGSNKKLKYGPGIAGTQGELAEALGVDRKSIRKWIKMEAWDLPETPPFKIKKVKEWVENNLDPHLSKTNREMNRELAKGDYSKSPLTVARVEGTVERTLLIRQRRLLEEGKLIFAEEAQRLRLRQIYEVKSVLLSLPRSIANALVGKSRDKIEETMTERLKEIIATFAGK